jgi:hypothetical protein
MNQPQRVCLGNQPRDVLQPPLEDVSGHGPIHDLAQAEEERVRHNIGVPAC